MTLGYEDDEKLTTIISTPISISVRAETILSWVRAEIEHLPNDNPSYWNTCDVVDREKVLDIIDKYRKEQE